jgi:hypothetical protein
MMEVSSSRGRNSSLCYEIRMNAFYRLKDGKYVDSSEIEVKPPLQQKLWTALLGQ